MSSKFIVCVTETSLLDLNRLYQTARAATQNTSAPPHAPANEADVERALIRVRFRRPRLGAPARLRGWTDLDGPGVRDGQFQQAG
eukprot:1542887-Rhodomonas_salina.3